MARWSKKLPTEEGWYVCYNGMFESYGVWHLHPATKEAGFDNVPLKLGKLCWGTNETDDAFPDFHFGIGNHKRFMKLERPNA